MKRNLSVTPGGRHLLDALDESRLKDSALLCAIQIIPGAL
jgi:hypothetical protein